MDKIKVEILRTEGKAALVQWFTEAVNGPIPHRGTIPAAKIKDGEVEAAMLEAAIPYGLPWEKLKLPLPTAEQLAVELRRHGVWTAADFRHNPNQAMAAVTDVFGRPFKALAEFVNHIKSGGKL